MANNTLQTKKAVAATSIRYIATELLPHDKKPDIKNGNNLVVEFYIRFFPAFIN